VNWLNFLCGIFYSYLPKELWGSWRPSSTVDFEHSALVSGLLERALSLTLLIQGYVHFLVIRTHQMQSVAQANEGTELYFMWILSVEYLFHPLSLIAIYLVAEGIVRSWAVFFTDEVIPSFPVKLFILIADWRKTQRQKASVGPPLPDLFERVQRQGYELQISSQLPKDGWRASLTVSVDGEFYEIARVETRNSDRRFVYLLRRLPAGSVIRGVYRYDPPSQADDVSGSED
jgi:hypothetical protein